MSSRNFKNNLGLVEILYDFYNLSGSIFNLILFKHNADNQTFHPNYHGHNRKNAQGGFG
jgi:hypothetical protein